MLPLAVSLLLPPSPLSLPYSPTSLLQTSLSLSSYCAYATDKQQASKQYGSMLLPFSGGNMRVNLCSSASYDGVIDTFERRMVEDLDSKVVYVVYSEV